MFTTSKRKNSSNFLSICCDVKCLCFCHVISVVLICSRVLGILPIVPIKAANHINSCKFKVSKPWLYYSYSIQVCYLIYFASISLMRLLCQSEHSHSSDWYLRTFGYMLVNLNSMIILFFGTIRAQRICKMFNNLSLLYNSTKSLKQLKKIATLLTAVVMLAYFVMLLGCFYVVWIRLEPYNITFYCYLQDSSVRAIIGGIILIFSYVQVIFFTILYFIISNQFNYVSQSICAYFKIKSISTASIKLSAEHGNLSSLKLEKLIERQESLIDYLEEINECIGLQTLSEISTNLYLMVYYLYRFCIVSQDVPITSTSREKHLYSFLFIYRITALLTYLIVGYMVHINSKKPLKVLQQSKIITYPAEIQQTIQSLILQWSGRTSNISAFGFLNVGPWLLAPTLSNVITYLLVALQFKAPDNEKSTH